MNTRKPYPSDVCDDEWAFVAPYLTLMAEDAPQRDHPLREVFIFILQRRPLDRSHRRPVAHDAERSDALVHRLPADQRWLRAGSFESIVHDLRELLRVAQGRTPQPTAAIFDGRTLQSTPESGGRAGWDGAKKRNGSKVHMAVDTLGHLLALLVTPANDQERAQVAELAKAVQEATGTTKTRTNRKKDPMPILQVFDGSCKSLIPLCAPTWPRCWRTG